MHLHVAVRELTLLKVGLVGAIVKDIRHSGAFQQWSDIVQLERGALYVQLEVHSKALAPRSSVRFEKRNANG